MLNGTENSRPAFILEAGIVHLAASRPISSQRAPRASPARTAVNAIISTHNTADGCMYFTRRIAPSAAATSRCGSARYQAGKRPTGRRDHAATYWRILSSATRTRTRGTGFAGCMFHMCTSRSRLRQVLLEIYFAVLVETKRNDFDTH